MRKPIISTNHITIYNLRDETVRNTIINSHPTIKIIQSPPKKVGLFSVSGIGYGVYAKKKSSREK